MQVAIGVIIGGLAVGLGYGLLGFAVVFLHRTTGVANFAAGSMATFETFLVWQLIQSGMATWLAVLCGFVLAAVFGVVIYEVVFRPAEGKGPLNMLVRTLALWLLLPAILELKWANGEPFNFPNVLPTGGFTVAGVVVPWSDPTIALIACGLALSVSAILRRTSGGLQLAAMAQDFNTARLIGLRVRVLSAIAWAVVGVLTLIAGLLFVPSQLLSSTMMDDILLYGMAAAVVGGGLNSLGGALVGGMIIGLVTDLIAEYASASYSLAAALVVLTATLLVRPEGLFGARVRERL